MTSVFAYASRPHYARHVEPIVKELHARGVDVTMTLPGGPIPTVDDVVLVGSAADMKDLPLRRIVYVEHGAGQTYRGDPTVPTLGYPGGDGHDDVELFICPSQRVADLWKARYPNAATSVVGCPALDRYHRDDFKLPDPTRPKVAFTFHWPSALCPEASTAWPMYYRAVEKLIPEMLRRGWGMLGHEHPRWDGQLNDNWRMLGVPVLSYAAVMAEATVLVADNSSMLPEFASTGRPVVFLNSYDYRRDVDHGGRFWQWPEGQVTVDDPVGLQDAIVDAVLYDRPDTSEARRRMVDSVYAYRDGKAAVRAADAVQRLLASSARRR